MPHKDPEASGAYKRTWYQNNKNRHQASNKAWKAANAAKLKAYRKARHRALKLEVIAAYGGVCRCCGEREPSFLTIGHVNNDGAAHRREIGRLIYDWLKKHSFPQDRFELQCFNCNSGANCNGGVCPHKVQ